MLMTNVDDPPWSNAASGYTIRVSRTTNGRATIDLQRAGTAPVTLKSVSGLQGDPANFNELAVGFQGTNSEGATEFVVFWNGTHVMTCCDPTNAFKLPGFSGFTSYSPNGQSGLTQFDDFEINPAPRLTLPTGGQVIPYRPGQHLAFAIEDVDANGNIDLDVSAPIAQGGLGIRVAFFLFAHPGSFVDHGISWIDLQPFLRVDPTTLKVSFEMDSTALAPLFQLSNGSPVAIAVQAKDSAGSFGRRWVLFQ